MQENITYALIHSPLVGPFSWELVYQHMVSMGVSALLPALVDESESGRTYWQQHCDSVATELAKLPADENIVLVAHSGAGPLLPAIRHRTTHAICSYVFVDAGIPYNGLSRIDMMKLEDREWAEQFHQALSKGEQFPTWTEDDLKKLIPAGEARRRLVAEIKPRSLTFFTEPIPVFNGWPDAPCIYIKFSEAYDWDAKEAKKNDWDVYELDAGHFHMLVEPLHVAELVLNGIQKLLDAPKLK